jgi:hypothetical protein
MEYYSRTTHLTYTTPKGKRKRQDVGFSPMKKSANIPVRYDIMELVFTRTIMSILQPKILNTRNEIIADYCNGDHHIYNQKKNNIDSISNPEEKRRYAKLRELKVFYGALPYVTIDSFKTHLQRIQLLQENENRNAEIEENIRLLNTENYIETFDEYDIFYNYSQAFIYFFHQYYLPFIQAISITHNRAQISGDLTRIRQFLNDTRHPNSQYFTLTSVREQMNHMFPINDASGNYIFTIYYNKLFQDILPLNEQTPEMSVWLEKWLTYLINLLYNALLENPNQD